MVRYVTLKEASVVLGIVESALVISAKYKPFYVKSDKGKYNSKFNLDGYLTRTENELLLTERTKLFTEYLYHIEGITYTTMGKQVGKSSAIIHNCGYGFEVALALCRAYKESYEWIRFHKYYGWKI